MVPHKSINFLMTQKSELTSTAWLFPDIFYMFDFSWNQQLLKLPSHPTVVNCDDTYPCGDGTWKECYFDSHLVIHVWKSKCYLKSLLFRKLEEAYNLDVNANSHLSDESSAKCVISLGIYYSFRGTNGLGNIKVIFHLLVVSSYLKPWE